MQRFGVVDQYRHRAGRRPPASLASLTGSGLASVNTSITPLLPPESRSGDSRGASPMTWVPEASSDQASTTSAVDLPDRIGPATANPGTRPRSGPTQPSSSPPTATAARRTPRAQPSRQRHGLAQRNAGRQCLYPQRRGRYRGVREPRAARSARSWPCPAPGHSGSEPAKASCTSQAAGSSTPRPSAGARGHDAPGHPRELDVVGVGQP